MSKILQFKITLSGSKPKIWRRFQAEDNLAFYDLHLIIQNVMGWTNSHLYQFVYEKNNYIGSPEMLENDDIADDKETALSAIFDKPKEKVYYEYDFGDGWKHEVVVEKILEKNPSQVYPHCLAGEGNCPPEDCGGIYGFYNMMEAVKNKKHPEHEEMLEWLGGEYNPDFFDIDDANESLKSFRDVDMGFN